MLKTNNLCAKVKKQVIFEDINLDIKPGQVIGLLGHNGAGKSTILRLIANHETPQQGSVVINGNINDINILNKDVLLIPDTILLLKKKTIMQNYNIICRNKDYDKETFIKYLEIINLDGSEQINSLSKGNQEIVQLMIYLSLKTKIYLLDEPFSAVDIFRRELVQKLLIDTMLRNEDAIIVLTTHLINEVENILDHVLYLNDGKIVIDAPIDECMQNHDTLVDYLKETFYAEVGYAKLI